MSEILYFIKHQEEPGLWLLNYDTAQPTFAEAHDRRRRFLEVCDYLDPKHVRVVRCRVTPIRRKPKRGAKR